MKKQLKTYVSNFDVTLSTTKLTEREARKLHLNPEISFDEIQESGDLDLMISTAPIQ